MGKKRVHELAKEYGLDTKDVLAKLQAAGVDVKSHSSSVYEEEARAVLGKGKAPEAPDSAPDSADKALDVSPSCDPHVSWLTGPRT